MTRRSVFRGIFWGACVLTALVAVRPAYAQQAPPQTDPLAPQVGQPSTRPYRGLFGGGVSDTEQLLAVNVSFSGGYDHSLTRVQPVASTENPPRRGGAFGGLSGGMSYRLSRDRAGVDASYGTSARFYGGGSGQTLASHHAGVTGHFGLTGKTSLSVGQQFTYRPYNVNRLFPAAFDPLTGQVEVPDPDEEFVREKFVSWTTNVRLAQQLTQRLAGHLGYSYMVNDRSTGGRYEVQGALGRLSFGLAKGLGLRAGYELTEFSYKTTGAVHRFRYHNIDAGVDFSRALSLSRRTTLSFSTGSMVAGDRGRTHVWLTGNARLRHEIGRTWNASLAYGRNVQFVEALQAPVFSDALTVAVSGLVNRRVQVSSNVSASAGGVGFGGDLSGVLTTRGTVGLHTALTRYLGVNVSYAYVYHSFQANVALPPGVPRTFERQSIRMSMNLWVPLFQTARRP